MRTRRRFYFAASVTTLVAILLFQATIISVTRALVGSTIPFIEHTIAGSFDGARSVYATDVDGDGDIDVLGAAFLADEITWWENDGSENFTEHTIDGDFDYAISVYAIDVDGDEDVDVLGAAYFANDITWWENDGGENFTEHTIDGDFSRAYSVYAADVDGDGDIDVLGAASIADDITWWENDGSENFTEHIIADDFNGANSVYAIDVDGDGDVDVLGTAVNAGDITWWENDGSESFAEHTIDDNFLDASSVYATDLDNDGDVDVLGAAHNGWDNISWWENDGSQDFAKHPIGAYYGYWEMGGNSAYATDLDGDGDEDILGAASFLSDGDIVWWENDGSESFTGHTIDGDFEGASSVYATDLDGDGDVDVLGAADDDDDITWWEQEHGSVLPPTVASFPFYDGFESGTLGTDWRIYTTYEGRARVGSSHPYAGSHSLLLDDGDYNTVISHAAAILTIDLGGQSRVELDFWWRDFNTAYGACDVFISEDGTNWYPALSLGGETSAWRPAIVDIDAVATANGLTVSDRFQIKFQSIGNQPIDDNGCAIDEVRVHEGSYRLYLPAVLRNASPPSVPVLKPIDNSDGDGNYTLSWSSSSGAAEYVLEEDDNALFTSPTTVYSDTSTSTAITGREVGIYYYRVRATNSFGSSPWSNVVSVQVTQSPTPTPTASPQTWVNVINHCSCTVYVDFVGPETESVVLFAGGTRVVLLTPGTYYYEIDSIGCGSASGFVTIPHTVEFDFHIYCTSSMDVGTMETGQERAGCANIQLAPP